MKRIIFIFLALASISLFAEEKTDEIFGYLEIDRADSSGYLNSIESSWSDRLLELEPNNALYNCNVAKKYYLYNSENYKKKGFLYAKKAADIEPENAEYNYILSCYYGYFGMHEDALESAKKALHLNGDSGIYNHRYALCLLKANRDEEALEYAEKALSIEQKKAYYRYVLAFVNFRLGKNEDALKYVLLALYMRPKNITYQNFAIEVFKSIPEPSIKTISDISIVYLDTGNLEEALYLSQKAHEAEPDDMMLACNFMRCLFKEKRYEQALPIARKMVRLYPDERIPNYRLAEILFNFGEYEESLVYMKKAFDLSPRTAIYNYCMARVLVRLNRHKEALPYAQLALRFMHWDESYRTKIFNLLSDLYDPDDLEENCNHVKMLLEVYMYDDALSAAQKLVDRFPDSSECNYLLAMAHRRLRNYEAALPYARKAALMEPFNKNFKELEIECLFNTGDKKSLVDCISEFPDALSLSPEHKNMLAKSLFECEKYKEALAYFDDSYKYWDNDDENYMLAFCHWKLGEFEKALPYARKAFEKRTYSPQYNNPFFNDYSNSKYPALLLDCRLKTYVAELECEYDIARCYAAMGRYSKALPYLEKILPHYSDNAEFNFYAYLCYWGLDDLEKGMLYIKKAIALNPENVSYLTEISDATSIKGMHEDSIFFLKKLAEGYPESWVFFRIAESYMNLEKYEDALEYAKKSFELSDENDKYQDGFIAHCLYKLERYEESLKYAKLALENSPESIGLQKFVSELEEKLKNQK